MAQAEPAEMQNNPDRAFRFVPPTEHNPVTAARFRREAWWQVTFPVLLVTFLLIGVVVALFVFSGPVGTSVVADYALIFVLLPALVGGLMILALLVGLIVLMARLIEGLPPYAYVAQKGMAKAYSVTDSVMQKITSFAITVVGAINGLVYFVTLKIRELQALIEHQQARPTGGSTSAGEEAKP
ncbi:MAG: hypothetical protein IT326_00170 [Anaerolineae bacterium]|mgnify:CR=1 FL=1|nr:hypothetical protein [Anaerolineae bacterium]